MNNSKSKIARQLTVSIVIVIVFSISLCITTFALFYATVTVSGNVFQTGTVKIALNGGAPVITQSEYLFEPGMTVEKSFDITNQGTGNVYYKIYMSDIDGGLADVLEITVYDGTEVLYQGTARNMTRENVLPARDALPVGQSRNLKIRFHYPENSRNESQNWELSFNLCADAVQEKNNPDKKFD